MKQEKIFEALTDIGDDLLELARNKRYINHWKRWGRTAACLALVLCLTALVLPYFPMGCGSATEEAAPSVEEAPAAKQEAAIEETPAEEAPMADAVEPEESKAEAVTVWFDDTAYEIQHGVTAIPEDLGEQLGEVLSSDGRDLTGCRVYAALESEDIYVEAPEGYLRGVKTE